MKTYMKIRQLLLGFGLVVLFSMAVRDGVRASDHCYADWSQAAPIVAKEKLATARQVQKLVQDKLLARVVRMTLCKGARGYEYRLVAFAKNGKIRKLTIDARKPVVQVANGR